MTPKYGIHECLHMEDTEEDLKLIKYAGDWYLEVIKDVTTFISVIKKDGKWKVEDTDTDDVDNPMYRIKYCPWCGEKLDE